MKAPDATEHALNQYVGGQVMRYRTKARLTQDQVATTVGLSRPTIANIEMGRHSTGIFNLVLISEAVGADVTDLLPGSLDTIPNLPPPVVELIVRTHHPERYVLINAQDGSQWVWEADRWAALRHQRYVRRGT